MKHAAATHARVALRRTDGHLDLTVSDDGAGFDPGLVAHNGLAGLSDRFAALAGTVTIEACPDAGTVLRARLPVDPGPA